MRDRTYERDFNFVFKTQEDTLAMVHALQVKHAWVHCKYERECSYDYKFLYWCASVCVSDNCMCASACQYVHRVSVVRQ